MNDTKHTPLAINPREAEEIAALMLSHAAKERADAEGKIHNVRISRIKEAERFEGFAERFQAWAVQEQARRNHANSSGVRAWRAAREQS